MGRRGPAARCCRDRPARFRSRGFHEDLGEHAEKSRRRDDRVQDRTAALGHLQTREIGRG